MPENIKYLGEVSEEKLAELYGNCKGFIATALNEDFGMNVLEAMGVLQQDRSEVTIQKFLVSKQTMQLQSKESEGDIVNRIKLISDFVNKKIKTLPSEEESLLKETYGKEFMTDKYFINEYEILNNGSEKDVK